MRSIVVATRKIEEYIKLGQTSFLLPLKGYSTSYEKEYSMEQICELKQNYPNCEFFVVINKMIFNEDLESLEVILKQLAELFIAGVFFYDLAVLELVQKQHLDIALVWNQTHMVTNSRTCNFYFENGVEYAVIAGELEQSEIMGLVHNTKIKLFYTLVSMPVVAHSRRFLLSNYYKKKHQGEGHSLTIHEKVQEQDYLVTENEMGTNFFEQKIPNHYSLLEDFGVDYVILNESYIEHDMFMHLLDATNQYLRGDISFGLLLSLVEPYLDSNVPFLFNKTVYRVKKEVK